MIKSPDHLCQTVTSSEKTENSESEKEYYDDLFPVEPQGTQALLETLMYEMLDPYSLTKAKTAPVEPEEDSDPEPPLLSERSGAEYWQDITASAAQSRRNSKISLSKCSRKGESVHGVDVDEPPDFYEEICVPRAVAMRLGENKTGEIRAIEDCHGVAMRLTIENIVCLSGSSDKVATVKALLLSSGETPLCGDEQGRRGSSGSHANDAGAEQESASKELPLGLQGAGITDPSATSPKSVPKRRAKYPIPTGVESAASGRARHGIWSSVPEACAAGFVDRATIALSNLVTDSAVSNAMAISTLVSSTGLKVVALISDCSEGCHSSVNDAMEDISTRDEGGGSEESAGELVSWLGLADQMFK